MEKQTTQELLLKIQELENKLKTLQKTKKYGLVFEEKPEIFEENSKNALPLLKEEKELEINNISNLSQKETELTNIIIEGDNFHSLSCLKYTHKNKIDVIYIDPPYNTGNKDFIYNDKRITEKYDDGSYVGKDDPFRHSKWLSFMKKRLFLARDLLSEKGVIFISIDNNEFAQLKLLCDEVFGEELTDIMIWRKAEGKLKNTTTFRKEHEYIIICYKNEKKLNKVFLGIKESLKNDSFNLRVNIGNEKSGYFYKIVNLEYSWEGYWKYPEDEMNEMIKKGEIIFKNGNVPRGKPIAKNVILDSILDIGSSSEGKRDLGKIFGEDFLNELNITPKPKNLIKLLANLSSQKNSIILDFFAGSGTTGHAVMELNREDGGNRQFILCSNKESTQENPNKNICKNITYERNKRVILGYTNNKGEKIEGLGGKLKYYTTQFIKTESSIDDLRLKFINMCDDMLCIKENTFEKVNLKTPSLIPHQGGGQGNDSETGGVGDFLKLYTNNSDFTVILYDVYYFDDLLKLVKTLNGKIKIYIFSIAKEIYEEELEIINNNIEIANIPDEILETYKKIFNF